MAKHFGTSGNMATLRRVFISIAALCMPMTLIGCALFEEQEGPTNQELMNSFYDAQVSTLEALDQAFSEMAREYGILEIEYRQMGRPEMADVTAKKAASFHERHLAFQETLLELRAKQARGSRGEQATAITLTEKAPEMPPPAPQPAAIQAPPVQPTPVEAVPAPAPVQPAPAPAPPAPERIQTIEIPPPPPPAIPQPQDPPAEDQPEEKKPQPPPFVPRSPDTISDPPPPPQ